MALDLHMPLSDNFRLSEFIRSETASRRGIRNVPGPQQIAALEQLCLNILQPVRNQFGRAVIVTSGYRSPTLNKAIGGSSSSQHTKGEAADFTVSGVSNMDVCRFIRDHRPFDQLIYEFGETGWVHVSYRVGRLRHQTLRAVKRGGRTRYLSGLMG